jgi:hypothetical protein
MQAIQPIANRGRGSEIWLAPVDGGGAIARANPKSHALSDWGNPSIEDTEDGRQ